MRYHYWLLVSSVIAFALAGCNAQTFSPPAAAPATEAQKTPTKHIPHACEPIKSSAPLAMRQRPGYQELRVSVTDHQGRQVTDLHKDDFIVTEANSTRVAEFSEYVADGPASVVIAADTSGSTYPKLPQIRETMTQLVNNLDQRDDVAFYAVSGRPFLLQSFTTDHSLVIERESILHAGGMTSLFDGADLASIMASRGCYPRRAVIVISDGMDNASRKTADDAAKEARDRGVQVYAIGIGNHETAPAHIHFGPFTTTGSEEDAVNEESLGHLTKPTGGATFQIHQEGDYELLTAAAQAINENLGGQYVIGFIAPALDNDLSIAVKNHSDYIVTRPRIFPASGAPADLPTSAAGKSS